MALTPRVIQLIYCYLICLFSAFYLVINLSGLLNEVVKLFYFEETYTVEDRLLATEFSKSDRFKNLTPNEVEKIRQNEITEDKKRYLIRLRNSVLNDGIHTILAVMLLGIHTLIIRRSRLA